MGKRKYYSVRTGRNPARELDLPLARRLFGSTFSELQRAGYFQESLGDYCVDYPNLLPGSVGQDIEAFFVRKLRKDSLWPIRDNFESYSEDDLFDVVELLHDLVSKPLEGNHHRFGECGWHYTIFDKDEGRAYYRSQINELLEDYGEGFELSDEGEVLRRGVEGLHSLLEVDLPEIDAENIEERVEGAVKKFRRRQATSDDRRDAVRDVADVLEFLRPRLSEVLASGDESDLFNIANNFGIRHHNDEQRTDYDSEVWLDSLFYYYLNMIHTVTRLLSRETVEGVE